MSGVAERRRLLKTMRMMSTSAIMLHQVVADKLGLSLTDYKCLDILTRFGSMTAGKLTNMSGLTTGAVTGVIDRLERAGYARRADNPTDRRSVIVELTWNADQTRAYESIFSTLEKRMDKMTASYSDKELSFFTDFMGKIVDILRNETIEKSE